MSRSNAALSLPPSDRDDAPTPPPLPGSDLRERIAELKSIRIACSERGAKARRIIDRRMVLLVAELIRMEMGR